MDIHQRLALIKASGLPLGPRAVLFNMATHLEADDVGLVCVPTRTLVEETGCSRAQFYEHLKVLEARCWIERVKHPTRPRAKAFRILWPGVSGTRTHNPQVSEVQTHQCARSPEARQLEGRRVRGLDRTKAQVRRSDPTPPYNPPEKVLGDYKSSSLPRAREGEAFGAIWRRLLPDVPPPGARRLENWGGMELRSGLAAVLKRRQPPDDVLRYFWGSVKAIRAAGEAQDWSDDQLAALSRRRTEAREPRQPERPNAGAYRLFEATVVDEEVEADREAVMSILLAAADATAGGPR